MRTTKKTIVLFYFITAFVSLHIAPLTKQFNQLGYVEIAELYDKTRLYNSLYIYFDELIEFLQTNPVWAQKLYNAKERFIRSKDKNYYSSDFFGFYDESEKEGRRQIAFYYSTHFHEFIGTHYPELTQVNQIIRIFEAFHALQEPCAQLFHAAATELGISTIFPSNPPIIFKVIKYLPAYSPTRPHYDGTAFSLFLHSTDNQSLLLCPYKSAFRVEDFEAAIRLQHNSILLIPGSFLTEYSIYPTPHIVTHSGKTRYATIAFAMRPHYTPAKNEFSPLPNFKH